MRGSTRAAVARPSPSPAASRGRPRCRRRGARPGTGAPSRSSVSATAPELWCAAADRPWKCGASATPGAGVQHRRADPGGVGQVGALVRAPRPPARRATEAGRSAGRSPTQASTRVRPARPEVVGARAGGRRSGPPAGPRARPRPSQPGAGQPVREGGLVADHARRPRRPGPRACRVSTAMVQASRRRSGWGSGASRDLTSSPALSATTAPTPAPDAAVSRRRVGDMGDVRCCHTRRAARVTRRGSALDVVNREPGDASIRPLVKVLNVVLAPLSRRDWRGQERLPAAGGVIVVANHISNADPLALGQFLAYSGRWPRFLAKSSLFGVPGVGRAAARGRARSRSSGAAATPSTRSPRPGRRSRRGGRWSSTPRGRSPTTRTCGRCEGGRAPPGSRSPPAARSSRSGSGAPRSSCAAGRLGLPRFWARPTLRMLVGPPVPLDDLRGRPLDAGVLREATDRIMAALTALVARAARRAGARRAVRPARDRAATEARREGRGDGRGLLGHDVRAGRRRLRATRSRSGRVGPSSPRRSTRPAATPTTCPTSSCPATLRGGERPGGGDGRGVRGRARGPVAACCGRR